MKLAINGQQLSATRFLSVATLSMLLLTSCASACDSTASASVIKILNRAIYVSLEGSDKNDGLNSNTALRSPQKAADISEPGDVIFFAAGEYEIKQCEARQPSAVLRRFRINHELHEYFTKNFRVSFRVFGVFRGSPPPESGVSTALCRHSP